MEHDQLEMYNLKKKKKLTKQTSPVDSYLTLWASSKLQGGRDCSVGFSEVNSAKVAAKCSGSEPSRLCLHLGFVPD